MCGTVAELESGVEKSSRPEQNSLALIQFLEPMRVRRFDERASHNYGRIRAELKRAGKRIDPLDMLVAAQALADNLVLVTKNYQEFRRIEGLSTESW